MSARASLYTAVWRWHFYAGLLTLPFLVSLAVTGGLYLFKDEITAIVYSDLVGVEPRGAAPLAASRIVELAGTAAGGSATGYLPPAAADRSARVYVETGPGVVRDVFVDPYTGDVLGNLAKGDYGNLPLMHTVRNLHSLKILGVAGNALIEIVAGWALILVVTGVYLWWPRGRGGGVTIRRASGSRTFWRDLHAVTGAFAAVLVLFLVMTGLPWSVFWGEQLKNVTNAAGLGYPAGFWYPVAESSVPLADVVTPAPWALENAPVPASTPGNGDGDIGIDRAVAILDDLGIHPGYTLSLPAGPSGVYSASVVPDKVSGIRAIHLDRYGGDVLFDVGYADLGVVARTIELGTSLHVGEELGRPNQLSMLLACIAVLVMSVAAVAMWWKRRPRGSLGAPRLPRDVRAPRVVLAVAVAFGLVLPLVGLSIVAMLAIDAVLPRRLRERLS